MSTLRLNRGETTAVPFHITDAAGGLTGKRITWALAHEPDAPPVLTKASGMGATSADVLIASNTGTDVMGSIYVEAGDFAQLPDPTYNATLWVDSGTGDDACVTPGGADLVVIVPNVEREAP